MRFFLCVCLLLALPLQAAPQRVASLNMCLDPFLFLLLPRERIVSLTYLSAQPQLSSISGELDGLHLNHGLAEELVPLEPELILAGEFGAGQAVVLLRRLGYRVETLNQPRDVSEIAAHIRALGQLLGEDVRAEALAHALESRLAELDHRSLDLSRKPRALWYTPNGIVAGAHTLEDELLQRAGYRNLAAERGLQGFVHLDIENLLVMAPEVLVMEAGYLDAFSLAREYLRHPVLDKNTRRVELPAALSVCVAPQVAEALAQLIAARETGPREEEIP